MLDRLLPTATVGAFDSGSVVLSRSAPLVATSVVVESIAFVVIAVVVVIAAVVVDAGIVDATDSGSSAGNNVAPDNASCIGGGGGGGGGGGRGDDNGYYTPEPLSDDGRGSPEVPLPIDAPDGACRGGRARRETASWRA